MNHNLTITIYLLYAKLFLGLREMKKKKKERFLLNLKSHDLLRAELPSLITCGNQKDFISAAENIAQEHQIP